MSFTATARSIDGTLRHEIDVNGRHTITTDEPESLGGTDTAPAPHELLAATLASCVSTMIVLYARRRDWDLGDVRVDVEYDADTTPRLVEITVHLPAGLTAEQTERPSASPTHVPFAARSERGSRSTNDSSTTFPHGSCDDTHRGLAQQCVVVPSGCRRRTPTKLMPERDPKKFDPARAGILDAPEREQYLPSEKLVGLLELTGAETVLDYGAGTGRLTVLAAKAIPHGRILAVDESSEMLVHLQQRLAGTANAHAALISSNRVALHEGEADRILAVNLLHEIRGEDALREMRRVLAPKGILLVVDWERGRPRPSGPPDQLLYTAAEAASELRHAGFDTEDVAAGLPFHFVIRATPASADDDTR
jgi:putative redox protein